MLVPGVLFAETIPFSIGVTGFVGASPTTTSQNLSFAQFNPALGTLNSILVTLTTSSSTVVVTVRAKKTNKGADTPTGTATASALTLDINLPSGAPDLAANLGGPYSAACTTPTTALGECTSSTTTPSSSPNPGANTGTFLDNAFIGLGQWTAVLTLSNTLGFTAAGNVQDNTVTSIGSTVATLWNGTIEVTYVFTPTSSVPEPSTYALMGLSFVAFGARYFRRSK
jgi:hypothetical protein